MKKFLLSLFVIFLAYLCAYYTSGASEKQDMFELGNSPMVYNIKCAITGETDTALRRSNIEKYKNGDIKILINYGVLTTGFDAPRTNTAIIARPTNSLTLFSQMVGRATRGIKAGGNKECDIYVINDALPGFRDMAQAFRHWDDAWNEEDLENG